MQPTTEIDPNYFNCNYIAVIVLSGSFTHDQ